MITDEMAGQIRLFIEVARSDKQHGITTTKVQTKRKRMQKELHVLNMLLKEFDKMMTEEPVTATKIEITSKSPHEQIRELFGV
jgi:hypothetical protein